jgi:competence protein ComEA
MMKKIVAMSAMLFALASSAAVEANKASSAELGSIKGVGPALSKRIVDARGKAPFKDWADFMARVDGVKEKSAGRLSAAGLTVNGKTFGSAPAAAPAKAEPAKAGAGSAKPATKPAAKP